MFLERDKSFKPIATFKSEEIICICSKESFNEGERGEWKRCLKTQHSKTKTKNHGTPSHHFMTNIWGNSDRLYFLVSQNHWGSDWSYEIKRHLLLERIAISNTDSILKSRHFTLLTKFCIIKTVIFLVVMELDHKEGWALKNWCFQTVMLEKIPESPLDSKENQPVNPKGNQSWIFIGRTDAEAETLILWPPDARNWLIGREPDAVKDWRQEEKGTTENEMVGCYHWLNGHKFE